MNYNRSLCTVSRGDNRIARARARDGDGRVRGAVRRAAPHVRTFACLRRRRRPRRDRRHRAPRMRWTRVAARQGQRSRTRRRRCGAERRLSAAQGSRAASSATATGRVCGACAAPGRRTAPEQPVLELTRGREAFSLWVNFYDALGTYESFDVIYQDPNLSFYKKRSFLSFLFCENERFSKVVKRTLGSFYYF